MITITYGSGGDYSDLGAAWNYLVSLGALTDNYVLIQYSSFIEVTGLRAANKVTFNGNTVTILNPFKYTITLNSSTPKDGSDLLHFYNNSTITNDNLLVNGLIFNFVSGGDLNIITGGSGTIGLGSNYSQKFINCSIYGYNALYGTGFRTSDYDTDTIAINCRFYNLKVGINTLTSGTVANPSLFQNCSIYGCTTGISWAAVPDANSYTIISNTVISNPAVGGRCVSTNGNGRIVMQYCFDSDGSISAATISDSNTGTGITDADYLSVDPSSSNFLRIPSDKSLYAAGRTTGLLSDNTASIEGYPRPNIFGVVSIGAHEPNVAIDFVATPLDPAIVDIVQFNSIINEATIPSYLWNLDDGKTSVNTDPIDSYAIPGLKDISLVAYDSAGRSATVTKPNYIDVHPYQLGFTAEPSSGKCPLKVKFTSSFERQ